MNNDPQPPRFLLYDGRAKSGDTDSAAILDTARTENEARNLGLNLWEDYDAIWWEQECSVNGVLSDKRPRWDLPPAKEKLHA